MRNTNFPWLGPRFGMGLRDDNCGSTGFHLAMLRDFVRRRDKCAPGSYIGDSRLIESGDTE